MTLATVGQAVTFVDQYGKRRAAQITAVYPPEIGTRAVVDADGQDTEQQEEFEVRGERVDLIYAPNGVAALDPVTALVKNHALHESQQTPGAFGLRNFWTEAAVE